MPVQCCTVLCGTPVLQLCYDQQVRESYSRAKRRAACIYHSAVALMLLKTLSRTFYFNEAWSVLQHPAALHGAVWRRASFGRICLCVGMNDQARVCVCVRSQCLWLSNSVGNDWLQFKMLLAWAE